MSRELLLALEITGIGMGLVFAAIVLLWGVMSALVRLTPEKALEEPAEEPTVEVEAVANPEQETDLKRRAAAAAVAYVLQKQAEPAQARFAPPPTALVSAWQAVHRANALKKRGSVR